MNRRSLFTLSLLGLFGVGLLGSSGCRHPTHARVLNPGEKDMVGTTGAGAETFRPLVETAVGNLLARHTVAVHTAGGPGPAPLRISFVAVENKSAEEIGDFKDQIYELIDTHIANAPAYRPVSKRFIDAALRETALRPDELFLPKNMRTFAAALEQQGQPVDYLLYAKITSGTTHKRHDMQRDYVLTLELVNVNTGDYDKESAILRKKYDR